MKKISIIFLSFFLFSYIVYRSTHQEVQKVGDKKSENKNIKSLVKVSKVNGKPSFSHPKQVDLIEHRIVPKTKRAPASKAPMRNGRFLEGANSSKFTSPTESLTFKNKVNPKWKEILGKQLTRFLPEGTEILVQKEKSLIYIHKGIGQYREQVLVSYKLEDGRTSSHRSMVDSSTGKVLYNFNRQQNEYFRGRPRGLTHPLAQ